MKVHSDPVSVSLSESMPISWKKKFNPDVVLRRIALERTVSANGGVTFSGSGYHEHLPILASMLHFPEIADRLNKSSMIWAALCSPVAEIDQKAFLQAINRALAKELAVREQQYTLVTTVSLAPRIFPCSIRVLDAEIKSLPDGLPRTFRHRAETLASLHAPITNTPDNYLCIRVTVTDKGPASAAEKAIDRVDLLRGLLALFDNHAMQLSFSGTPSFEPINRIRCGGRHTIHFLNGKVAHQAVWFDPNFRPATTLRKPATPGILFRWTRLYLKRIPLSPYGSQIASALIRYARAFDEPDHSTAFLKLWSALESLLTPGIADYDRIVRRCSFLYTDQEYHKQVLEHLRDYRNASVHAGMDFEHARTNCYILQDYFRTLIHFLVGNRKHFQNLDEVNEFLDLPPDLERLAQKYRSVRRAMKFVIADGAVG